MLKISNLSKTYDNGVHALNNVNLDIPKGMFGLLGPNGAGKSSLMRTIATLQFADSGSITFDGIDIASNPQRIRSTLGYLPQDFGVYPRISAENMLDHMAVLKGIGDRKERHELVAELLHQTNLFNDRKKNLSGYSGGMRQRFGIAQALIGDPRLIIVDEPTAGLDPQERNRFHNLLSEIGENVVVILSTHIVEDVADLCPNMAILAAGKIVAQGKPETLTSNLRGRVWRRIINKSELELCRNKFDVISTRLLAGRHVIHVLADAQPNEAFEQLQPDLEDVYFSTLFGIKESRIASAA
ncbi:ABC transporter ATP-binding protein [Microbulbifer sp. OS29]|uniref:ABC transporter ATP-binding protein n=1 Tax=Microbulbifer okhotskensis TaxID=2926617 RepID=A0A9X2J3A5_9GAMM|nr:ABC transporter ATP-binding protein [Microbulbifer okhotskensis]MCO1332818.1 ABC transporter ATP-binding protein [Microbulbifer okhotskensis]